MGKEILILGAGFGGLEAASTLAERLDSSHTITLIDKSDHFIIGFSKFEVMFGRQTAEQVKSYYANLAHPRVRFLQDTIELIDPEKRRVRTRTATFGYDYLIVALGAELAPELTPGFVEDGYEFYSLAGAARLYPALDAFTAGTIVLSIFGAPYKCPPAPYEAAFQLHDFYRAKGVRDQVAIKMLIPAPVPLPVAPGAADEVKARFAERGIDLLTQHKVTALDPVVRQAHIAGREPLAYDLFIGVPLHRPPQVVRDSALGQGSWIPVGRENLTTAFDNVYAVGDVTTIPVGERAVPKAGAFAEDAAKVVANEIIRTITGQGQPLKFEAIGTCYLEVGEGNVAQISANYLGQDEPQVALEEPSAALREGKQHFKDDRIQRWFRQP
ncbi:MAG: FAD/NAD(P)-binding oxidoreductase [Candidatus Promineifilaceae bacterium]|nr:FAD/NAD(P)-binding oxidoreductase [Candidatus Promineifilaceae bacterium]